MFYDFCHRLKTIVRLWKEYLEKKSNYQKLFKFCHKRFLTPKNGVRNDIFLNKLMWVGGKGECW